MLLSNEMVNFFLQIFGATGWVSDTEYIFLFLLILLGLILSVPFLIKLFNKIVLKVRSRMLNTGNNNEAD